MITYVHDDEVIFPRRGIFVSPQQVRVVWNWRGTKPRLFLQDYDFRVVMAKPLHWVAVAWNRVPSWRKGYVARGVSPDPATIEDRWIRDNS